MGSGGSDPCHLFHTWWVCIPACLQCRLFTLGLAIQSIIILVIISQINLVTPPPLKQRLFWTALWKERSHKIRLPSKSHNSHHYCWLETTWQRFVRQKTRPLCCNFPNDCIDQSKLPPRKICSNNNHTHHQLNQWHCIVQLFKNKFIVAVSIIILFFFFKANLTAAYFRDSLCL